MVSKYYNQDKRKLYYAYQIKMLKQETTKEYSINTTANFIFSYQHVTINQQDIPLLGCGK